MLRRVWEKQLTCTKKVMLKDINIRGVITELLDIIKLRRLLVNPGQKYGHFTLKYYSVGIFEVHFTDEILDINLYRSINKEILSSISTSSTKSRSPSTRCFHEMCAKKCNCVLTAVHIPGEERKHHHISVGLRPGLWLGHGVLIFLLWIWWCSWDHCPIA